MRHHPPRTGATLLVALMLLSTTPSPGAGLDDVRDIDIVRVAKEGGQVHLYLVLDPSQSPLDTEVLRKVRRKLVAYRHYVTSGQVWKNETGSNPKQPVALTVLVTGRMTPEVQAALATLSPEFDTLPTTFRVVHMPREASSAAKQ
jgi:hypothetical protein